MAYRKEKLKVITRTASASTVGLMEKDAETVHFSLLFLRPQALNQIFIETIDLLIPSGVIKHAIGDDKYKKHVSKENEDHVVKPLTMGNLGVGFIAWAVGLGISFIVFLIEGALQHCD